MATAKISWIAAAVLLLAVAGGVTYMTSDVADEPAADPRVASAVRPVRSSKEPRAPRARPSDQPEAGVQPVETPAAWDASTSVAARPAQPDHVVRAVTGVVVDRATGRPLAGARVLLCHVSADGAAPSWQGGETDERGRFDCSFDETDDLSSGRMEVRARKTGYEPIRRAVERDEMRVELAPRDRPEEPGRVVGLAVDPEGRACPGRLLVEGMDDFGGYQAQWTRADAAGTFVLEGIPPGYWRIRADGDDNPFVEVLVPERGEARVQLRTEPPTPDTEMPHIAKLEQAVAELDDIRRQVDVIAQTPPSRVKRGQEAHERLSASVEALRIRVTTGRDVAVSGLPAGSGGAVARLSPKAGRNWFWRARVDGTGVKFEDLPAGSYVLRIETSAGLAEAGAFDVPAEGEGPLEVKLTAAK